jgi:hypothetical protein
MNSSIRIKVIVQQYFSYIVAVSFICGGNWITLIDNDLRQVTDKVYDVMFIEYTSPLPEKPTVLSQVTDKVDDVMFIEYTSPLPEKPTVLSQVTDKVYDVMFIEYTSP